MLVKKMKDDPRIDFENDWKLITLLIGGNDLCDYCEDRVSVLNTTPIITNGMPMDTAKAPLLRILSRIFIILKYMKTDKLPFM